MPGKEKPQICCTLPPETKIRLHFRCGGNRWAFGFHENFDRAGRKTDYFYALKLKGDSYKGDRAVKNKMDIAVIEMNKPSKEQAKSRIKELCTFLSKNWKSTKDIQKSDP